MQSGNYHHKLHHFHERYGPVVRIAPNELSYISSHAWQDIYGNPSITKNRLWALQEEKHHPVSILSTDEATHLRNRRALAGAFTDHAIAQHAALLERIVELMIEKFKASVNASSGLARVNVVDWFNFLTFDISGALSFGETFDCVRNGREHPWVEISCSFGKGIALMASINFFQPLNHILELAMPKTIMAKMKYHKQLSHEKLQRRLLERRLSKAQDYVGSIQAYNKEKGETKIPVDEIEANMTVLIFAGSETTSTALSAVMNQLLQSPVALEKARAEVRSAFDNENDISVSSVAHLEYLGAVIKEGIRMGPPAAVGMPRTIPKEGAIIMGQQVPGHVSLTSKTMINLRIC